MFGRKEHGYPSCFWCAGILCSDEPSPVESSPAQEEAQRLWAETRSMAQERVDQVALTADESLVIRMTLALGHEALPKSLKEIAAVLGFSRNKMAVSRIEKRAIKKIGLSTAG